MSKVFNNVKRFCAKSQLFAFCDKLWYNIYRKYERNVNRKEVNGMLQKIDKKDDMFIRKYECNCKKVMIKFKESYDYRKAKEIKSEELKMEFQEIRKTRHRELGFKTG